MRREPGGDKEELLILDHLVLNLLVRVLVHRDDPGFLSRLSGYDGITDEMSTFLLRHIPDDILYHAGYVLQEVIIGVILRHGHHTI